MFINYFIWFCVVRVSVEARRWWQYAITCTLDVIHSRRKANTWDSVLSAAKNNVSYVRAFMAQLENPTMMSEEDDKVIKETQDSFRSYEELKELRDISVYWVQKRISDQRSSVSSSPSRKSSQTSPQKPRLMR